MTTLVQLVFPWNGKLSALARYSDSGGPVSSPDGGVDIEDACSSAHDGQRIRSDKGIARSSSIHDIGLEGSHQRRLAALGSIVDASATECDDDVADAALDEDCADTLKAGDIVEVGLLATGEDRCLGLVDDQMGEVGVGFVGKGLCGRGIEEDGDVGGVCGAEGLQDGVEGDLELHDEQVWARAGQGGEVLRQESVVRLGGEDDAVLAAGLVDDDDGDAGLAVFTDGDGGGVDAVRGQAGDELLAVCVGADGANHGDIGGGGGEVGGARELAAGDGLVGAFAAGRGVEVVGGEGLAGERVVGDVGDEVDVEGAEDGDSRASHGCGFCGSGVVDVAAGE